MEHGDIVPTAMILLAKVRPAESCVSSTRSTAEIGVLAALSIIAWTGELMLPLDIDRSGRTSTLLV
jgi:hypothetical protein